ncbi:P-loop containing nucleoside triphosphate hydrolase protein [Biscogniauxia mediterranea]|nr:P-loop containing nucleoside triphosphate hydrolase protein [Biscogniauxia mediterranea]
MFPIISLLGVMGSGKGTLGPLVAAEFKLCHISIGDLMRAVCSPPIQEAGEYINKMIENGELVPSELIDTLSRSVALKVRIHNHRVVRDIVPSHIALPILQRKILDLEVEGTYNGVLLDGFPRQLDHCEEARELCFGPEFPTLVIYIDCPVEVARMRYLARARDGDTAASFDKRLAQFEEHMPSLLRKLADEGLLVRAVIDGSMTVDEAYELLVASLRMKHGMPL